MNINIYCPTKAKYLKRHCNSGLLYTFCLHTLLRISVISAVIYCISPSVILQIPFTVNNCNTLCIMGIFCDVRPHIQRLTVFLKIVVYYCIYCNGLFGSILLRLFYFPHFLHLDWHDLPYTVSTTPQQLGPDYTECVTSLVMMGKSVCPSCQKQRERLEHIYSYLYRASLYCPHPLVDGIYNKFCIVFYRIKIYVCLSVFVSDFCTPVYLTLVTFTCQHGGNKPFTMVNCAVVSNDFCQLTELKNNNLTSNTYISYINIRLTNVKFSSGVSS